MSTITSSVEAHTRRTATENTSAVYEFFASLFCIDLREKLATLRSGEKTDAIYAWGL